MVLSKIISYLLQDGCMFVVNRSRLYYMVRVRSHSYSGSPGQDYDRKQYGNLNTSDSYPAAISREAQPRNKAGCSVS